MKLFCILSEEPRPNHKPRFKVRSIFSTFKAAEEHLLTLRKELKGDEKTSFQFIAPARYILTDEDRFVHKSVYLQMIKEKDEHIKSLESKLKGDSSI